MKQNYFQQHCYSKASHNYKILVDKRKSNYKPNISVILPVYNTDLFLDKCLNSLRSQTYKYIEIICVDDGSTDSSLQKLTTHADGDCRLVIISQENMGVNCARNLAVNYSRGEYLYFCDSDDYLEVDALRKMYSVSKKHNLDMLLFNTYTEFESDDAYNKHRKKEYRRAHEYIGIYSGIQLMDEMLTNHEWMAPPWSSFIKKALFINFDLWFVPGITHGDNIYTFMSMYYAKRVFYIPDKLYHRVVRKMSMTTKTLSFEHAYGYYSCIINLNKMLTSLTNYNFLSKKYNEEKKYFTSAIEKFIEMIVLLCAKTYYRLPEYEQSKIEHLSINDKIMFKNILMHGKLTNDIMYYQIFHESMKKNLKNLFRLVFNKLFG